MSISRISVQHQCWSLNILSHNPKCVHCKQWLWEPGNSFPGAILFIQTESSHWKIQYLPSSKCRLNTVQAASRVSLRYFWEGGWVTGHVSPWLLKHTLLVIVCARSPFLPQRLKRKGKGVFWIPCLEGSYRGDAQLCLRSEWGREGGMEAVFYVKILRTRLCSHFSSCCQPSLECTRSPVVGP